MKIKVCDALCGAGKTQAAIKMMNENTGKRYIFVTPYLSEVERIKRDCAGREFVSPQYSSSTGYSKTRDLEQLVLDGANIACTHKLMTLADEGLREAIRKKGYTLILDETLETFKETEIMPADLKVLMEIGALKEGADNSLTFTVEEYGGELFSELKVLSRANNLFRVGESLYCWALTADLFRAFEDCYVLTYLFKHQILRGFFDVSGLDYEVVGVKYTEDGYVYCPVEEMDRAVELRDKIEILHNDKINAIGFHRNALSRSWFEKTPKEYKETLRKNLQNFLRNLCQCTAEERLWTTFKAFKKDVQSGGLISEFVPFNIRATNNYSRTKALAFAVNIYMHPWMDKYMRSRGVIINQDMYALSMLVQWVFRSAIRNNEKIQIYMPSRRMRRIFEVWLDNLAEGRDLEDIWYNDILSRESGRRSYLREMREYRRLNIRVADKKTRQQEKRKTENER